MKAAEIKNILLLNLYKIKSVMLEVFRLPHFYKYLILFIVSTLLFIVLTFPFDMFVVKELEKMKGVAFQDFSIQGMNISLLAKSSADEVNIIYLDKKELNLKNLGADISFISLISRELKSDLSIEKMKYISENETYEASLVLKTDLKLSNTDSIPEKGTVNLALNAISVKGLNLQGFTIPPIKFKNFTFKANANAGDLIISDCSFTGEDLMGKIRGSIKLNPQNIGYSLLNLTLDIDTRSMLIQNYKMLLGSLMNVNQQFITININGTLSSPQSQLTQLFK